MAPDGSSEVAARSARRIYLKDILRVGRWCIGRRPWLVTRRTLARIVENWRRARERGVRVPVVWNHSHDARDQIGEVLALHAEGDVLHACFWAADPDDVRRLGVTVNQVSVEVHEPWRDGLGNLYDVMLVHLGVVDLPVVSAQQPFQRIALSLNGGPIMVSDSPTPEPLANPESHAPLNEQVGELTRRINAILAALGSEYFLAETTAAEDLLTRLATLLDQIRTAKENGAGADPDTVEALVRLKLDYDRLASELKAEREESAAQRRRIFTASLDRLIAEGRVAPADRPAILEAATPGGFGLGVLGPFERIPHGTVIPTTRRARLGADPSPPTVTELGPMTVERAGQIARDFRD